MPNYGMAETLQTQGHRREHDMNDDQNPYQQQPTPEQPPITPPVTPYAATAEMEADPKARTWGMLCHLTALSGYIGVPFGWAIGPLIFWLIKKDEMPFVDDQGKESLNFGISVVIYAVASAVLTIVLIGFLMLAALGIFHLVMVIMASIRANQGVYFRYPLCIRFIK